MINIATMIGAPDLEQETLAVYGGDRVAAFEKLAALGYDGVELMSIKSLRQFIPSFES